MASPFSEIIYLLSKAMYDRAKTPSLSHSVCDPNDTPAAGDGATQHLTENKTYEMVQCRNAVVIQTGLIYC